MKVLKAGDKVFFPGKEEDTFPIPDGGVMFRDGVEYRFESDRHFLVESVEETAGAKIVTFVNPSIGTIKKYARLDNSEFEDRVGEIVELIFTD